LTQLSILIEFGDSRGGSVSTVTWLRAGRPEFESRQGQGFFSSPPHSDRLCGPPSHLSSGYREDLLLGVKWPERESDHVFTVWFLVQYRDNFAFGVPMNFESLREYFVIDLLYEILVWEMCEVLYCSCDINVAVNTVRTESCL
jgi:hypothetical protein